MRHDHHAPGELVEEALEPVEPVEVEVVGGLVEEEHVELREQDGGQRGARGLAARQRPHVLVEQPGGEPELVPQRPDAGVEVGAAERQPAVEGGGVAVVAAGLGGGQRVGGLVELGRGGRDAGAAGEEVAHGLAGPALRLLGQVADGPNGGRA